MKSIFNILFIAVVSAEVPAELAKAAAAEGPASNKEVAGAVPPASNVHFFDFDNASMLYHNNFEQYRVDREAQAQGDPSNNCHLAESDNYLGAQQCKFSWECRGARMCDRGGWCNGYDACEESPFPLQSNGLLPDH
jgi:hypothetical protein